MKSLSKILLVSIVVLGGLLAATPVFAEKSLSAAPKGEGASVKLVSPLTGKSASNVSDLSPEEEAFSSTSFTAELAKDFAAAEAEARFQNFVSSVSNGNASQVTGIYSENILAFPVVFQPSSNAGFVSTEAGTVTKFAMASQYGSTAFLAHNYLAGASFFELSEGQIITLVYGDGRSADFQIQSMRHYQALSPESPYSNFVDLDNGGSQLSASDLFYSVYNSDNPVVLQTCIENDGVSSWGRLFVIAVPVS